jgi:hypothetical protein
MFIIIFRQSLNERKEPINWKSQVEPLIMRRDLEILMRFIDVTLIIVIINKIN